MLARRAVRFLHYAARGVFALAVAGVLAALLARVLVAYGAPHLSAVARVFALLVLDSVAVRCCGVAVLAFAFDVAVAAVEASFIQREG